MKKAAAIFLIFAMALALCACTDTYDPAESAPVPKYDVCVDFSQSDDDEVWDEESGDCIYSQTVCAPAVISAGGERAVEKINSDMNKQHELFLEGAAAMKNSALSLVDENARPDAEIYENEEAPDNQSEKYPNCVYETTADLTRGDTGVISICYDTFSYSGGAHGYTSRVCANYDSKTGDRLTLDMISEEPDLLRQLAYGYLLNISTGEKYQSNGACIFFNEDLTADLSELVNGENWYFSEEGIVFYANPYDIAPYGYGRIDFTVPYAAMEGLLKEKYVPAAFEGENGMMLAENGENMDRSNVEILGAVILDEDMQSVVISAEETVYSVELVSLNSDAVSAAYGNILWYRSYMTTDEAVEVICSIPDTQPNVLLRYTLADGTVIERGISQSGKDGSIILVEIEPVVVN